MTNNTISNIRINNQISQGQPAVRLDGATSRQGDTITLHPTSFSAYPGQVVGIAGGSGAGKTTLLEVMAGVQPVDSGRVRRNADIAFVPQDDIIHQELPLRRTLEHAAALRIRDLSATARRQMVDRVIERLDLADRADVPVGNLSGGQRKRASLAAEMLTDPELFFLDEPTSGLDPAHAADLMGSLRSLADAGSTIVVTTHSPADLLSCDRVVFVARGGHVAFVGSPAEAKRYFGVDELSEIYALLDEPPEQPAWIDVPIDPEPWGDGACAIPSGPGAVQQWRALVRRNVDLIASNRLTLAILVGSPVFIISMMAMLFPSGAFEAVTGNPSLAVQTLFWMAFNSFFFGLTYGLLQVVGEMPIVRRERRVGLSSGAYVASKLSVLVPLLAIVNAAQMIAMESANRLPALSMGDRLGLFVSFQLLSTAAVTLGLHASSAVCNSSQATLALPMLCFPQVLFAGAVVPVSEMGWLAEAMSMPLAVRWGFEPVGRVLDLGPMAAGTPGTAGFAETFSGAATQGWIVLALMTIFGTVGTIRTITKRTAVGCGCS